MYNSSRSMKLIDLLKIAPPETLNWAEISKNDNIFMEDIERNIENSERTLPWNWVTILKNNNLTIDFVKKYYRNINMSYNMWDDISACENISLRDIIKNPQFDSRKFMRWNWATISRRSHIDISIILSNLNKPWDWRAISRKVTAEFVVKNLYHKNIRIPWIFYEVNIDNSSVEFMISNICCKRTNVLIQWDWHKISNMCNIQYKLDNLYYCTNQLCIKIPWIFETDNPSTIAANLYYPGCSFHNVPPEKIPWQWSKVDYNKMNIELYLDSMYYKDGSRVPWDTRKMMSCKVIMDIINLFPEMKWDWRSLSYNKHLTNEFIYKHLYMNWDWYNIKFNNGFNKSLSELNTIFIPAIVKIIASYI